jgi:hypothetical protein
LQAYERIEEDNIFITLNVLKIKIVRQDQYVKTFGCNVTSVNIETEINCDIPVPDDAFEVSGFIFDAFV